MGLGMYVGRIAFCEDEAVEAGGLDTSPAHASSSSDAPKLAATAVLRNVRRTIRPPAEIPGVRIGVYANCSLITSRPKRTRRSLVTGLLDRPQAKQGSALRFGHSGQTR